MDDEVLTFKEAARLLRVSDKTLVKLLAEEDIPARKLGNKWVFSKNALLAWVASGKSKEYTRSANIQHDEIKEDE